MFRPAIAVLLAALFPAAGIAQQWGDLSLRFVYDAKPLPVPEPLLGVAGVAGCAAALVREDLLVNPKDAGVANVLVYLYSKPGEEISAHPSYQKTAKDEIQMAAKGCRFEPHVVVVRTTQTFVGVNAHPVGYNMRVEFFDNPSFNMLLAAGAKFQSPLPKAELNPAPVTCNIHGWMSGWILVRDNPYSEISDKSGKIKIANLPAGNWTFLVWHERHGFIKNATVAGKPVEWKRGRVELEIKPGANDLGDVLLNPQIFK